MYKKTLRKRTSIEKYKLKINDCGEKHETVEGEYKSYTQRTL